MIKWIQHKWINRHVPSLDDQIEELAQMLMDEEPVWPPVDGGAVDIAIALIRQKRERIVELEEELKALQEYEASKRGAW